MKFESIQDALLGSSIGYLYDFLTTDTIDNYDLSSPNEVDKISKALNIIFSTNCTQIAATLCVVSENPLIKQVINFYKYPIITGVALSLLFINKKTNLLTNRIKNNVYFFGGYVYFYAGVIGSTSRAIMITALFTSAFFTSSVRDLSCGLSLTVDYLNEKCSPNTRNYVDMTRLTMAVVTVVSFLSTYPPIFLYWPSPHTPVMVSNS